MEEQRDTMDGEVISQTESGKPVRRRKRWIWWAAGGAAVLVLVITAVILSANPMQPILSSSQTGVQPKPVIVEKNGEVWLLCAENAVSLGTDADFFAESDEYDMYELSYSTINGTTSGDNRYFYYMSGFDHTSGKGTLMGVAADASAKPVRIASGVGAAQISEDGESVLYVSGIENGAGVMYLCQNGVSAVAAKAVMPDYFGFSPDAHSYFYFAKTDIGYALHACVESSDKAIDETDAFERAQVYLDNDGQMYYSFCGAPETDFMFYLYSDGKSELLAKNVMPMQIFGRADELLYYVVDYGTFDGTLYYKKPGQEAVRVSSSSNFSILTNGDLWNYSIVPTKRIIVGEIGQGTEETVYEYADGEEISYTTEVAGPVSIYEVELDGGGKILIAQDVGNDFEQMTNTGMDAVIFGMNGGLYICKKNDGKWSQPVLLSENSINFEQFNKTGNKFYWLEDLNSTLWCHDIKTGENTQLAQDISSFAFIGDDLFALSYTDTYYLVNEDGTEEFCTNATITDTLGGVYVVTQDGEYIYYPEGADEGVTVFSGAEETLATTSLRYTVLSIESRAALARLYEDARYYIDEVNGTNHGILDSPHGTPEEDMAAAEQLMEQPLPWHIDRVLDDFREGFNDICIETEVETQIVYENGSAMLLEKAVIDYENIIPKF